jgi:hypothetical protein
MLVKGEDSKYIIQETLLSVDDNLLEDFRGSIKEIEPKDEVVLSNEIIKKYFINKYTEEYFNYGYVFIYQVFPLILHHILWL